MSKILIFEDDKLLRDMYVTKYKLEGFAVTAYDNPSKDPVQIVLREQPDIISMDVLMPVMDGFQAAKAIKADARTAKIPLFFLTTLGQPENIRGGKALGAVDYFVKGQSSPTQVVQRVRAILGLPNPTPKPTIPLQAVQRESLATEHVSATQPQMHLQKMTPSKPLYRIIRLNILLYLATFLVAAIVLALKSIPLQFSAPPTGNQIFIAMVTGIILTTLGAWWYFRTTVGSFRAGLQFGLIAILVGFAMDAVVSVGIWVSGKNPLDFLRTSYTYFFFGLMLLAVLGLTGVVGWAARRRTD